MPTILCENTFLTENPLRFNILKLKYIEINFVYESPYAVCNGRVSGCFSTCLLWKMSGGAGNDCLNLNFRQNFP